MREYVRFQTPIQNFRVSEDEACGGWFAGSSCKGFWSKKPCTRFLILGLILALLIPSAFARAESNQSSVGSFEQLKKLADDGNAEAQFKMGRIYEEGLAGGLEDYKEAARWYLKAAEKGNAQAQYKMGTLYTLGKGVPKDRLEAAKWFGKAAPQGYEPVKQQIQESGTKLKDQLLKDPVGFLQRKFGG
jgi:hypothetical protein